MKSFSNNLRDPLICSCLPNSYYFFLCNKIKWSTLSIGIALLIIIVYLSSGLYALLDVTTILASQASRPKPDMFLWPIASSSWITIIGWVTVAVYFTVVLLVTLLICGVQLNKSWLLLLWSIIMILMVLIDGIVTVLSIRENQLQNYRSAAQAKILLFVMSVRLFVSLVGILVTIFHFRRLKKIDEQEKHRQKMLDRYNKDQSPTPSYHESWAWHVSIPKPVKENHEERRAEDLFPPLTLPRAKVASIPQHPASNMYQSYNSPNQYLDRMQQPSLQTGIDSYDDFRYNIPLQERFHQQQIRNTQGF